MNSSVSCGFLKFGLALGCRILREFFCVSCRHCEQFFEKTAWWLGRSGFCVAKMCYECVARSKIHKNSSKVVNFYKNSKPTSRSVR